ncbi:MAG: NUDIX hydrolase [Deinococcota bacterium]
MKRDVLYQGAILDLIKLDNHWEVIEHQDAVCVLVVNGSNVLGVEQPRPALGVRTWELPAGLIDAGETPEQAARRELAEETQHGGDLELITQVYSSPGFCTEKVYIFEALDVHPADGQPEASEDITIVWRNVQEAWELIKNGQLVTSAHTALALSYALERSMLKTL